MKNDVLSALSKKAEDSRVKLNGLADLLDDSDNISVKEISIDKLLENANHPFKVTDNAETVYEACEVRQRNNETACKCGV